MIDVVEQEVEQEEKEVSELRWLADSYTQTQKTRIAMENRVRAVAQSVDTGPPPPAIVEAVVQMMKAEKNIQSYMMKAVKEHPAWPFIDSVKGISGTLRCKILGLLDIEKTRHISGFWKFCGLGVTNGEKDKLVKGEKAPYSKRAKVVMYLIGGSFLKCNSPYRRVYDEAKIQYEAKHPEWTVGHIHNASMRKMEKIFLSHLWIEWRKALGLPTELPYALAQLGHKVEYKVEDFVS